ncbi:hypothetical protein ACFL6O_02440 [candidate division KSB1 bacterium]
MKSLSISSTKDVIEMWLQRSLLFVDAHSNSANYYLKYHYALGIFIIFLSGIMALPVAQSYNNYIGTLTVILASIYVILGLNEKGEQHRRASKYYGEIMRELEIQKASS